MRCVCVGERVVRWNQNEHLRELRLWYAHQRGVHFLIEQPISSVLALVHFWFSSKLPKHTRRVHGDITNAPAMQQVMFAWEPVRRFLIATGARTGHVDLLNHIALVQDIHIETLTIN